MPLNLISAKDTRAQTKQHRIANSILEFSRLQGEIPGNIEYASRHGETSATIFVGHELSKLACKTLKHKLTSLGYLVTIHKRRNYMRDCWTISWE